MQTYHPSLAFRDIKMAFIVIVFKQIYQTICYLISLSQETPLIVMCQAREGIVILHEHI